MKRWRYLLYVVLILLLLLGWQQLSSHNDRARLLISSPSLIYQYSLSHAQELLHAFSVTLLESFLGLLIAVVFSFGMMVVCFYFPSLLHFVLPVMVVSQVVPLVTLAPLFILLFGLGISAKVMMAALLCFFPLFVNFASGVKQIAPSIHELMFVYQATTTQKIRHVFFPLAMPSIMAGLKISATLAVIGSVVAEFNGAQLGLGKNLFLAAKRLEPELMMNSLLLSSLAGGGMYLLIYLLEKKLGKWYVQQNG